LKINHLTNRYDGFNKKIMGIHISVYRKGKLQQNGRHSFLNVTEKMPFDPQMRFGHWGFADDVLNYGKCVDLVNWRTGGDVFRPTNFEAIRAVAPNPLSRDLKLDDVLNEVEKDESLYFDFDGHVLNSI
jgi:hypothetical protein